GAGLEDVLVVPGHVVGDRDVAGAIDVEGAAVPGVVIAGRTVAPHHVARRDDMPRSLQEADAGRARVIVRVHVPGRVAQHLVVVVDAVVDDARALAVVGDLDALLVPGDLVVADGHARRGVRVDAEAVVVPNHVAGDDDSRGAVLRADSRTR